MIHLDRAEIAKGLLPATIARMPIPTDENIKNCATIAFMVADAFIEQATTPRLHPNSDALDEAAPSVVSSGHELVNQAQKCTDDFSCDHVWHDQICSFCGRER